MPSRRVSAEIPPARHAGLPERAYQACLPPQWGHPTEVETGASNTKPHWQV
jgi:hypothetical protein